MSVNLSDLENTESAAQEFDQLVGRRQRQKQQRLDGEVVREHVETADDPDTVRVEVDDESIPMEPVGLGQRARISRDAIQAGERGDEAATLDAVVRMIDTLIEHSPEEYDQAYWDGLDELTVKGAFRSLGQQSAGGNEQ